MDTAELLARARAKIVEQQARVKAALGEKRVAEEGVSRYAHQPRPGGTSGFFDERRRRDRTCWHAGSWIEGVALAEAGPIRA